MKSAKFTRHFSDDKLNNLTQRQKNTIGLIKEKKISKDFRTRLKSEDRRGKSDIAISESQKGYVNLVHLYIKRNMARLLCHCLIVLLLCLCGVVMIHHNVGGTTNNTLIHNTEGYKHNHNNYITAPESSILLVSIYNLI